MLGLLVFAAARFGLDGLVRKARVTSRWLSYGLVRTLRNGCVWHRRLRLRGVWNGCYGQASSGTALWCTAMFAVVARGQDRTLGCGPARLASAVQGEASCAEAR